MARIQGHLLSDIRGICSLSLKMPASLEDELTAENTTIAEKTPLNPFAIFAFSAVNFRSFAASPRQAIRGKNSEARETGVERTPAIPADDRTARSVARAKVRRAT
jgi:hypothetical protein